MQHRRVFRPIQRAEICAEFADALIAIDFQVEHFHHERVTRLRAVDVKRPGERIVAFHQRHRVARLLDRVAETVERICIENICRLQDARPAAPSRRHISRCRSSR